MDTNSNRVCVTGSTLGTTLTSLLVCDEILPGSAPSYQLCKEIYLMHPLGAKLVETPVKMAQSLPRQITIKDAPADMVREAFEREWNRIKCDEHIRGCMYQARIYGIGSVIYGAPNVDTNKPMDPWTLWKEEIYFNILDPLNTSGSLVLDQNPNSPTYQKHGDITAAGQTYHRSRACVMMNEQPVYIAYTSSAFGYVGRSVYQRALFPLKSFVQSMITDDMVTRKAGLIIAMIKMAGSIVNNLMQKAAGIKRRLLREAGTDNVLSIDIEEKIESINLQNTDTAMTTARSNILKNIATAADMPAIILEQETFANSAIGGEGTEDTKNVIRYVNGVRKEMQPLYEFFDRIVQHRAWNEQFFEAVKTAYPELYEGKDYKTVFYEWQENFQAIWPSLLEEPQSELSKQEKVKLDGLVQVFSAMNMGADPDNKARLAEWVMNNLNEYKNLFPIPLDLDIEALAAYEPELVETDE